MTTPRTSLFLAASIAAAAAACGAPVHAVIAHDDRVVIAQPSAASSLVKMTAEPSADLTLAEVAGELAVRIRIEAPPLADKDRPSLNLALVLDTSASMEGEAIEHLKEAANEVVQQMSDQDRLTLVTFSSHAELALESTALDSRGRAAAAHAIDKIRATGTTDLASGLTMGVQQVLAHRVGGIDRLVLVADGFPNDPLPIPALVQSASASAVPITTLGIGLEASESMLRTIAQDTGGVYRYAPDGTQIAEVFHKELVRMQTMVARDMSIQIVPGPGIEIGDASWISGNGRQRWVNLGDLAAGEVRDVFVPLDVPGHKAGLTIELLDANLSFVDALAGTAQTRSAFVGVKAATDKAAIAASTRTDLVQGQARAAAAGAIIEAINLARGGAVDDAKKLLGDAEQAARASAAKLKDAELLAIADRMVELSRNLQQMRVQTQVILPTPGVTQSASEAKMTQVPAQAPASVEPAIRVEYDRASSQLDGRH